MAKGAKMTRTEWHGSLKLVYFNTENRRYCLENVDHDPRRTPSYYPTQGDMTAMDWEFVRQQPPAVRG